MPTYYPIDETAARRAKEMNSYHDYKPGSATAAYRQEVDKATAIAETQKARVDPMYHEKIDRLLDTYARKLAENINQSHAIAARCPSVLITGPANFPVRKKEKQNRAADANMKEWQEIQGILARIRGVGTAGISSDDENALQKLREKLARHEREQVEMKAINAYYRKHGTLDGCPLLSAEETEKIKAAMARDWRANPKPYESYLLSNNNQTIRSVKARIAELEAKQSSPAPEGWSFDGGRVVMNREENRIQILFDDKPDAGTRSELKHAGFRWAPGQGAWQRMLNQNGVYAAKELTKQWTVSAEQTEITTEQPVSEEPCSEEPAPFSYLQQSM
ncbi:hypothetical protein [uncultured Oscillibacter sp.]|uniref:hypothetical protein n=1 Tax=uncultured Oscillibacter sp. TaxID=876091 RepID=UPI002615F940|nr:hypothetical protein [uncultured Oscillibacter sp.]